MASAPSPSPILVEVLRYLKAITNINQVLHFKRKNKFHESLLFHVLKGDELDKTHVVGQGK